MNTYPHKRYFLFQAALIPCICLRNEPSAPEGPEWRKQIITTLQAISAMAPQNATSGRCHGIILSLCGRFLDDGQVQQLQLPRMSPEGDVPPPPAAAAMDESLMAQAQWLEGDQPTGESPQTQINNVLGMMWPNAPPMEAADVVMGDDAAWMEFLRAGSGEGWVDSTFVE